MSATTKSILNMDQYLHLFKSEQACKEFADVLTGHANVGLRVILFHEEVIGASLSAEGAKEVLFQRLVRNLSDNPDTIDKLTKRLREDTIVD